MLSSQMLAALNTQINAEFYSAYLYLAMAARAEGLNFRGAARWFRMQHQEEWGHAMKLYDYIFSRLGQVELKGIAAPADKWDSLQAMFDATMTHEQEVTRRINDLMNMAIKDADHATTAFLQWYVNEQVEEESSVDQILHQLRMINNAPAGLFMLDRELGARAG
jgi:ferritin